MEKEVFYKSKKPRPVLLLTSLLFLVIGIIADYLKDQQLFNDILFYLVMGSISSIYLITMLVITYSSVIILRNGFILKKSIKRFKRSYSWTEIAKININIKHPSTIEIVLKTGKSKRCLMAMNIEDLVKIAYILHIININIDCSGLIKDNWKQDALEQKKDGLLH